MSIGTLKFSAFTSVLKVLIETSDRSSLEDMNDLLRDELIQDSVLSSNRSFHALLESLEEVKEHDLLTQLEFFDNCVTRLVKKPVYYMDLTQYFMDDSQNRLSLLMSTISEQWSFVVKAGDSERELSISAWIAKLIGLLSAVGEDEVALSKIRDAMCDSTSNKKSKYILEKTRKTAPKESGNGNDGPNTHDRELPTNARGKRDPNANLSEQFGILPVEGTSHPVLNRWEKEDLGVSIEEGHIGNLILCLCSEHEEIRRQASTGLSRFMKKLQVGAIIYNPRREVQP